MSTNQEEGGVEYHGVERTCRRRSCTSARSRCSMALCGVLGRSGPGIFFSDCTHSQWHSHLMLLEAEGWVSPLRRKETAVRWSKVHRTGPREGLVSAVCL